MTDSESDTSNVFAFPNANTTVSAKGPNTKITNLSFRNPIPSMYMPRNFERQRYAESAFDQRSMYYRRETSPMSIHSACDVRPRNFQQYYTGSSQRSVFNGRSGSPMSMRSLDSTASVSAADIAFAFKNVKFNKSDLKVIKDAYSKLMKQRVRKRIEKRRNLRLFLKGNRRRSGYDSGELGSDSSISSDDCRSVKTSYNEMASNRSEKNDLINCRNTIVDRDMVKDCSENFRQNTFKNMFAVGFGNVNNSQSFNNTLNSKPSHLPTQKDRFRNGFLLPSQRFNKSVASSVIPENTEKLHHNINRVKNLNAQIKRNINNNCTSGSEEEIFSKTVRETSSYNVESHGKRRLGIHDDADLPDKKKTKISPISKLQKDKSAPEPVLTNHKPLHCNKENSMNFEFAKPTLPVRKSKPRVQEKLIAKSTMPLTDFLEPVSNQIREVVELQPLNIQEKSSNNEVQLEQSNTTQNSDVSMRPSFIKRKLFTQKLDVAEKANVSSDCNSPQSSVYSQQKEKSKARKLVTNQSCLNRDVQEDSNLLDLIHKIVPPDQMNVTNQTATNQTRTDSHINKNRLSEDKWDVTSVISMCNEDDVSDTYTDEEIFEACNNKDTKKIKDKNLRTNLKSTDINIKSNLQLPQCKIVVEKIQNKNNVQNKINNQNKNATHNNVTNTSVKNTAKSFWDTDFESDAECLTPVKQNHVFDTVKKANATLEANKLDFKKPVGYANQFSKKSLNIPEASKTLNNTSLNNTVMNNTLKFNTSTLSIRSHRSVVKKKCCNETCVKETKMKPDKQNKIQGNKIINVDGVNKKHAGDNFSSEVKNKAATKTSKPKTPNVKLSDKITKSDNRNTVTEKSPKNDKQTETAQNKNKSQAKSKPVNSKEKQTKSKAQKNGSTPKSKEGNQVKQDKKEKSNLIKAVKPNDSTKNKTKIVKQNSSMNSKENNPVPQPTKLDNTLQNNSIRSERPVRSCRASSQNRSVENSKFSNISSDMNKSLRSRVINLSSSIENITIQIKPRNKAINNKNISLINTRKSDVSFSLGTPTPKKNLARNRADFFKGKRRT